MPKTAGPQFRIKPTTTRFKGIDTPHIHIPTEVLGPAEYTGCLSTACKLFGDAHLPARFNAIHATLTCLQFSPQRGEPKQAKETCERRPRLTLAGPPSRDGGQGTVDAHRAGGQTNPAGILAKQDPRHW